ncbi:MAG: GNAT family N-acetyltransferase [Bacteroidales bacterium]
MNLKIERTAETDFFKTEFLTREVFWNLYKPGCVEHLILHNLRQSGSYVPELDLVAWCNGEIIGHIITTRAKVVDDSGRDHEVLCAGPFAVLRQDQGKGTGSLLMQFSISEAGKLGFKGIILFGNPEYYRRFGFRNAQAYGITTEDGQNFDPFMALELYEHALNGISGRFFHDRAFSVNEQALEAFEELFPYREKKKTETQF